MSGTAVKDETEDESSSEENMRTFPFPFMPKLVTYSTSVSMEDEWMRRDEAVETVAQYCDVPEGDPLRIRPKRTTSESAVFDAGVRQNALAKERIIGSDEEPCIFALDEL